MKGRIIYNTQNGEHDRKEFRSINGLVKILKYLEYTGGHYEADIKIEDSW